MIYYCIQRQATKHYAQRKTSLEEYMSHKHKKRAENYTPCVYCGYLWVLAYGMILIFFFILALFLNIFFFLQWACAFLKMGNNGHANFKNNIEQNVSSTFCLEWPGAIDLVWSRQHWGQVYPFQSCERTDAEAQVIFSPLFTVSNNHFICCSPQRL